MSEDYKISSVFFVRDIKTLHIPCKAVNKIGLYINNWIRLGKKIVYIHLFSKQASSSQANKLSSSLESSI